MNNSKRYVPWANWSEWRYVMKLLYSTDCEQQWEGVKIVDAWKCRSAGIPVSVESTALFTEISLKMDDCLKREIADCSSSMYTELIYASSLAMIRMVNGMIDVEQKGVYSKSVNAIAEEIGLPRYFVDLRHKCTHSELPTFDVLLNGLKNGKQWLFDYYWAKQDQAISRHIDTIAQQLILVGQIAASNCDSSVFNKKGEVSQILKGIFAYTSTSDMIQFLIPLLAGISIENNMSCTPLILPDFSISPVVEQKLWLDNWSHVIQIASNRWKGFTDCAVENCLIHIVLQKGEGIECEWMMALVCHVMSVGYVTKKNGKYNEMCDGEILRSKGYSLDRYISILLKSSSSTVIDFLESKFSSYISEDLKDLISLRKQMISIYSFDNNTPSNADNDNYLQQMMSSLSTDKEDRSAYYSGCLQRYDPSSIPIGSILL